jgi:hypothetical protein
MLMKIKSKSLSEAEELPKETSVPKAKITPVPMVKTVPVPKV